MPPKKRSKRGAHLVSLNKAHPKHDVKHDIDAEPDEDFRPEDAPGDESEDDDDDDLDHESSNPELEKIRAAGRARKKRSRASAAAAKSTPSISTFFRPRATTPSPPPPPPTGTLQPPRGQSPPTVPVSPSPPEPFSGNAAGTNADDAACPICFEVLDPAATGNSACVSLECRHVFHAGCMVAYARSDAPGSRACPLCRDTPGGPTPPSSAAPKKQQETQPAEEKLAPGPTVSVNGIRIGRPPGTSGEKLSRAASSASHRGQTAHALGGSTHESSAERTRLRLERSAAHRSAVPAPPKKQRADAGQERGQQLLTNFPDELVARLSAINHGRKLRRSDVVGGDRMDPPEWEAVCTSDWELRRARAMLAWAVERGKGLGVDAAAEKAAVGVMLGADAKQLTPRTLLQWLRDYVAAGGQIEPSQRGRHPKTVSYLNDEDVRQKAVEWLRANVQAARRKVAPGEHPAPPLTVLRFLEWVNTSLLKDLLANNPTCKPICEKTAHNWLHSLGFKYSRPSPLPIHQHSLINTPLSSSTALVLTLTLTLTLTQPSPSP